MRLSIFRLKFYIIVCLSFVGYLKPIDKNDPEVVSAARFAADKLNGTLVEVLSAQEQVGY